MSKLTLIYFWSSKRLTAMCIGLACLGLIGISPLPGEVLLSCSFQQQNDLSGWKSKKRNAPWEMENGSVVASGREAFDALQSGDFKSINNGCFDLTVEVRFESDIIDPYNRFYLRLRNTKKNAGYEVVIAQGTPNNTVVGLVGKSALTKNIKSAYTFPTNEFSTIRWTRDDQGQMKVFLNGNLYLKAEDASLSEFDLLELGTRSYLAEGDPGPSAIRHFFRNVELKSGSENP